MDSLDIARGVASQFLADLIAGPQGSVVNLTFEKPDGSRVSINLLRGSADYIAQVLSARVALVHHATTKPTTILKLTKVNQLLLN